MKNKLKHIQQTLLTGWSFMRFLRLFLAIIMISESFRLGDWMLGAFGSFFLWQALANTGCCAVHNTQQSNEQNKEVIFEEIK